MSVWASAPARSRGEFVETLRPHDRAWAEATLCPRSRVSLLLAAGYNGSRPRLILGDRRPHPPDFLHETCFQFKCLSAFLDRGGDRANRRAWATRGSRSWPTCRTPGRPACSKSGNSRSATALGTASAADLERQCLHDERRGRSAAAVLASGLDRAGPATIGPSAASTPSGPCGWPPRSAPEASDRAGRPA